MHELDEVFKRRLLAGARAFPLEDCGSIPGYEELVACFQTPRTSSMKMRDTGCSGRAKWTPMASRPFRYGIRKEEFRQSGEVYTQ
ncbi:MAG: plasmid pRiA4b ORF-3 family protein [Planctomycetota bacterium]|nr:plasmid pRiA4b ORF-3 family protein [Planctomycetota bacterium]